MQKSMLIVGLVFFIAFGSGCLTSGLQTKRQESTNRLTEQQSAAQDITAMVENTAKPQSLSITSPDGTSVSIPASKTRVTLTDAENYTGDLREENTFSIKKSLPWFIGGAVFLMALAVFAVVVVVVIKMTAVGRASDRVIGGAVSRFDALLSAEKDPEKRANLERARADLLAEQKPRK